MPAPPPPPDFARPRPGDHFGPYRLVRELGAGSSGIVFLADLLHTGDTPTPTPTPPAPHQVALKILRPQRLANPHAAARFWRTAELAARIAGPNICPIEARGMHAGTPYLALRYLDGTTLAAAIHARRAMERAPTATTIRLGAPSPSRASLLLQFEKLARALQHLHDQRITHRDFKPTNVLIDPDGEPWLLDFGLLVDAEHAAAATPAAGSPAYLAPELLAGTGTPGVATDLYAFGVTLFEAATAQLPFTSQQPAELLREIEAGRRPNAHELDRTLPLDLDLVLDRLLQPHPADRPASAAEVAEDLRRVRERLPIAARRVRLRVRAQRWLSQHPLAAVTLTVLLLSIPILWQLLHAERRALADADLLASHAVLAAATESMQRLLPARPENLPALRAWLARFDGEDGLTARRARVEARLAALRAAAEMGPPSAEAGREELEQELRATEAMPSLLAGASRWLPATDCLRPSLDRHARDLEAALDDADQAARTPRFVFAEPSDRHLFDQLQELATTLAAATGPQGPLAALRRALANEEAAARELVAQQAAWARAAQQVAASPAYAAAVARGLRLEPQLGLVPLGADPASGLQEFAVLGSGRVPPRDAAGQLSPQADDAIVLVLLPGGTYLMGTGPAPGSPHYYSGTLPDESPSHLVELEAFLLAKYELTQAQWHRLGGLDTNILRTGDRVGERTIDDRHPAEGMTFAAAEQLLRANGLQLPTEVQWEYAADAGGARAPYRDRANLLDLPDGYPASHAPIGSFAANAFGLHDLHGNAAEMVADHYSNYDLAPARPGDGRRLGWRPERISRGGSFLHYEPDAMIARRGALPDFGLLPFVGVRPARTLQAR